MRQGISSLQKLSRWIPLCCVFAVWFCWLPRLSQATDQTSSPSGTSSLPAPSRLDSVVVTATRSEAKASDVPAAITTLHADDITFSGALAVDDLLRQIPGFNTFRRSSSLVTAPAQDEDAQGVTLRGIGPGGASRALVLVYGIPVNDAFGSWLYWGELPLRDIDRIEVVRGRTSHLWGNFALSGVINILTKPIEERAISTTVLGGNRGTSDATFPLSDIRGPLRYRVSGNFFRTNGWNIIIPRQFGPMDQDSDSAHKTINGFLRWRNRI